MHFEPQRINKDLTWLLEDDEANPGVRYFALRDLLRYHESDPEVVRARNQVMQTGPVPQILANQMPEGYWVKSGSGYSPKYRATSWQLLILAELGADGNDECIQRGCHYQLDHGIAKNGAFSAVQDCVISGCVTCLNGNLLYALVRLGFGDDIRVQQAYDWLTHAITGETPMHYIKSGTSGPGFACSFNGGSPCEWGAAKALKALLCAPDALRTATWQRAVEMGCEFLLNSAPIQALENRDVKVSSTWFKLGFPLSYWSDILEVLASLRTAGYAADPRLETATQFILDKKHPLGGYKMENSLNGKMWVDIEEKGRPGKWVTLRVLRTFQDVITNPDRMRHI